MAVRLEVCYLYHKTSSLSSTFTMKRCDILEFSCQNKLLQFQYYFAWLVKMAGYDVDVYSDSWILPLPTTQGKVVGLCLVLSCSDIGGGGQKSAQACVLGRVVSGRPLSGPAAASQVTDLGHKWRPCPQILPPLNLAKAWPGTGWRNMWCLLFLEVNSVLSLLQS